MSNGTTFCSSEAFPFNFFNVDGNAVNGTLNEQGFCTFPTANCASDVPVYDCCQATAESKETGSSYLFIAFSFIFAPIFFLKMYKPSSSENGETGVSSEEKKERTPSWVNKLPGIFRTLFLFGMYAYVTMQILVPIFMRESIQMRLTVNERNAIIASEAFIVPYNEIFQFIEDIILVRVNYALGRGDKKLTNTLVHLGFVGALVSGILAAVVGTILGAIPPILKALTIPGAANDMQLYPGCDIIIDSTDGIFPYWLVKMWAMPGTQLGMVLSGFMMGAMELETVGWIGATSLSMTLIVWYTKSLSAANKILVLGGAEFTTAWCMPILSTLYLITPVGKDLREHTGVTLQFEKLVSSFGNLMSRKAPTKNNEIKDTEPAQHVETASPETALPENVDEEGAETSIEATPGQDKMIEDADNTDAQDSKALLIDGLKIMFMDVAIQACISLSVYLALASDGADGYQMAALQSALPTYGMAYALGMGIVFKIAAPQLLEKKLFKMFYILARMTVFCAFLLVPLIAGSVVPFLRQMAYDYGENACEYAKDDACVPFFNRVFGPNSTGGKFTLPFTYAAFAAGASIDAVFLVLRSVLLALVDLDYMMRCTMIAIIIYIPCIVVASIVPPFGGQAISFFVAMYVPQFVLVVCFAIRFEILIRRIMKGARGSWTSSRGKSMRNIRMQS